tara:strand:+ start:141 stop:1514 length:1374 start_codon:yes stop_codon:yes gene_type:complete
VSTASLWFVIPVLKGHFNGFWIAVTVCFVAQGDIGSSLTKCINRLIGTIVCCAFCLLTLRIVSTSFALAAIVMVVFVFAASLWRDLKHHGYAALTAAFTTPVLLFGGQQYSEGVNFALEKYIVSRVEMTVLGVVLYMIVEVFLWPTRPRDAIRKSTSGFFERVAEFAGEASESVKAVANAKRKEQQQQQQQQQQQEEKEKEEKQPLTNVVDVTISINTIPMAACQQCFRKVRRARTQALALLKTSKSYHFAASSEPDLYQSSNDAYPPFRWDLLRRYQTRLTCDMKRLERAVCQLRPPLLKEEGRRGGDYDSMMEIGFKCVNIVSQFALACSDVYRKNEHFIFSGGGDGDVTSSMEEKQLLIVKVTSTFRRWKSVLHQVELKRHQWYETFFSQFDDDDEQEEGSGIGEIENKDDDEYTLALEQHNQIILAAITQAASDIVRNIGAIGESLEGVWLLK